MERSKADFKALREMVGMSQQALADALHVDKRSIQRWEAHGNAWEPPADAWDVLDAARERQRWTVANAIEIANEPGNLHAPVLLTYWKSQEDYERAGHGGDYQMANANARIIAAILDGDGRAVSFGFGGLREAGANVDFGGE